MNEVQCCEAPVVPHNAVPEPGTAMLLAVAVFIAIVARMAVRRFC